MKTSVIVILVSTIALVGVLFLIPQDSKQEPPDLLRKNETVSNRPRPRPMDGRAIDPAGASGDDVYSPHMKKTLLDGEQTNFVSAHLWTRHFSGEEEDRFRFEDIRLALNRKPKSKAELDKLFLIPSELTAPRIGDYIADSLGKKVSGIVARVAVFTGSPQLDRLRGLRLSKDVQVYLLDENDPERSLRLDAEDLIVELEDGSIVGGHTDGPVTVFTPEGSVKGIGLRFNMNTGRFVLDKDIDGNLQNLSILGRDGPPANVKAKGPLVYEPVGEQSTDAKNHVQGKLTLDNDVVLAQGDIEVRAQKLIANVQRKGGAVTRIVLEDKVSAKTSRGTFSGARAVWKLGVEGAAASLIMDGPPVKAHLPGAGDLIPILGGSGDLDLFSDGRIRIEGLDGADTAERKIFIGPEVVLLNDNTRVSGKSLSLTLSKLPSFAAEALEDKRVLRVTEVSLDGKVAGSGPTGTLECEKLVYTRIHDELGRPDADNLDLHGATDVLYRPAAKLGEELKSGPAVGNAGDPLNLMTGEGPIRVSSTDGLSVRMDPRHRGKLKGWAKGDVIVRRYSAKNFDEEVFRIGAQRLDLDARERFEPALFSADQAIRYTLVREVISAIADGEVDLVIPGKLAGLGDRATYDGGTRDLTLIRTDPKESAEIKLTDQLKRQQVVRAPVIKWSELGGSVHATGGAVADLMAETLGYGSKKKDKASLPTKVVADDITAWFSQDDQGDSKRRIRELFAKGAVKVTQEGGAGLSGTSLRVGLQDSSMTLFGTPARVDLVRMDGEMKYLEWIVASSISIAEKTAFMTGPVQARLHASSRDLAMNIARTAPASRSQPKSEGLSPVDITAAQSLYVSERQILARGGANATQGDPLQDGFQLKGDRIILFLAQRDVPPEGTTPDASKTSFIRGLKVIHTVVDGNVDFNSRDLSGKGDVLEFDDTRQLIMLYRYQGNASLIWQGRQQGLRPRFDLDLSNRDNPRVISTLKPPAKDVR